MQIGVIKHVIYQQVMWGVEHCATRYEDMA